MTRCHDTDCDARHCGCGEHLAWGDHTCPRCIAKVRAKLRSLPDLVAALPDQAEHDEYNNRDDNEAADLLGPVVHPDDLTEIRFAVALGHPTAELPEEDHHPLSVLWRWVNALGYDYGDEWPATKQVTVSGAVDWLDTRLHRIAHDVGQDFGDFRHDISRVVTRLEVLLRDGEQIERGVSCPKCGQAELVREYREQTTSKGRRKIDADGYAIPDDGWRCPRQACSEWVTEETYRTKVGAAYLLHTDRLTASQFEQVYRVKTGTLRRWANKEWDSKAGEHRPPLLRSVGKGADGRKVYLVRDVLALRDRDAAHADERSA